MNTIPDPLEPTDMPVPGTEFADRVIGGSKGLSTLQATALLNKTALLQKQTQTNTEDIEALNSDVVALTLALG